jgi:hypothetical protein
MSLKLDRVKDPTNATYLEISAESLLAKFVAARTNGISSITSECKLVFEKMNPLAKLVESSTELKEAIVKILALPGWVVKPYKKVEGSEEACAKIRNDNAEITVINFKYVCSKLYSSLIIPGQDIFSLGYWQISNSDDDKFYQLEKLIVGVIAQDPEAKGLYKGVRELASRQLSEQDIFKGLPFSPAMMVTIRNTLPIVSSINSAYASLLLNSSYQSKMSSEDKAKDALFVKSLLVSVITIPFQIFSYNLSIIRPIYILTYKQTCAIQGATSAKSKQAGRDAVFTAQVAAINALSKDETKFNNLDFCVK